MHRFFEGFLYPSYTGGVVVPFRSEAAEAMWTQFASLWKSVNLNSTGYAFMQQPLLAGDVWIGWDHVARILGALRQKPDEFVAFAVPSGPKGRGYVPVLAGLAVPKGAPDKSGATALIDYLTKPETQIVTARSTGFFPVVKAPLPPDLAPGLKLAAAAMATLDPGTSIAVMRGQPVKHAKHAGRRIFGSGINLMHLYHGRIPFIWYLQRELGFVHKCFRGVATPQGCPTTYRAPVSRSPGSLRLRAGRLVGTARPC